MFMFSPENKQVYAFGIFFFKSSSNPDIKSMQQQYIHVRQYAKINQLLQQEAQVNLFYLENTATPQNNSFHSI